MSIFGKLRRAKQAADDQKDKKAAAADPKPKPAPYRHVPTHAATDALLGAPATWREEDKKAIQAQHQKRSQHNLTRNPSSLSNVTTLNRDQSFTSKDFIHSVTDQRRRYSRDWTSNTNVPRKGQLTSVASTTNSSMRSQFSPTEHSFGRSSMRRSRFDTAELAPPAENDTEPRAARPYSNAASPSKDVKFYLPSSRGISPSHSSEGSASSSPDSSFYEPTVPARHPSRPIALESTGRKFDDQDRFERLYQSLNRRVGDAPRLPVVSSMPDRYAPTNPDGQAENDLSFIDFGQTSNELGFSIAAH